MHAEWSSEGGGVVGRGVLLDYMAYAQEQNIGYSPVSDHAITTQDLDACASSQGVKFLEGDILLVRTGFVSWHNQATAEEQSRATSQGGGWAGVEGSKETLKWFWSKRFAAVAGDAIVFEVWPPTDVDFRKFRSRYTPMTTVSLQGSRVLHLRRLWSWNMHARRSIEEDYKLTEDDRT